jgi:hypothetical protein
MEFNKCSRCGNFYLSNSKVCPKCSTKDNLEMGTFKNYIEENGINSGLDVIAGETGISVKNLNRFLNYEGFEEYRSEINGISQIENNEGIDGITFN